VIDELTNGWQPLDALLIIAAVAAGVLVLRHAKQIARFLLILSVLLAVAYALDLWQMPALLDVLEVLR